MLGYGRDESAPTPGGMFVTNFVGERNIIADRQQHYRNLLAAVGSRFIVPAYTYSPRIRNPFRMHSRNVRNVFVICVLHIRHAKVWFLHQKSMVFGVQKGGFYIAKVWFLFFECCVVAICLECYRNLFAAKWQSVSSRRGSIYRARIYIRHPLCVCLVDIKSVLWQLCPLAKMVRLRWLCSVCLPVCRLFGYC